MKRILVLIDLSDITSELLRIAVIVARGLQSELILLHVALPNSEVVRREVRRDGSRRGIAAELRRHHRALQILAMECKKQGIAANARSVRGRSQKGNPAPKIIEEVRRLSPDMIILGSRGHGALYQLIVGSVTDAVVRKVNCPVLLVPGKLEPLAP